MLTALSILALLLVAVTMGLSLAHALEFPGKLRLDEPTYRAVQAIYYPGFTIGGFVGEFGSMLVLAALLYLTPTNSERFWWIAAALGLLIAGHATYWIVTHPVNSAWLQEFNSPARANSSSVCLPLPGRTGGTCAMSGSGRMWRGLVLRRSAFSR